MPKASTAKKTTAKKAPAKKTAAKKPATLSKTSRQSASQKKTTERVLHEFKHDELKSGKSGKVKIRKQAIAIAMSESGASNRKSKTEDK